MSNAPRIAPAVHALCTVLSLTTLLVGGDASRALDQIETAAADVAVACGTRIAVVLAFVADQRWVLSIDGRVAS